ncbi:CHAT domain-containing protein [Streptosporangium sp. G11]|uniref:CHAT domain-containing protein n=1 Tax=Streptosporangium sp. G11 TaxID=3436926 RepID=UPI003EBBAD0C
MMDEHAGVAVAAARRMALARSWNALMDEIRKRPGFEDFLHPPGIAELLPAAASGPVVIVNASTWRCDALVLTSDGLLSIELSGLTFAEVLERTDRYLRAIQEFEIAHKKAARLDNRAASRSEYWAARASMEQILIATQEWLWDRFTEPILDRLGLLTIPPADEAEWPRVWWCPTGLLALMPLHAAGYHAQSRTVLDHVISSYTPTVKALLEARRQALVRPAVSPEDRLLVVAMENTPGKTQLVSVARERKLLEAIFAGRHTVLADAAATRAGVAAGLATHRWVHLSCHGTQNLADPSRGGLLLADGMLRIAELGVDHHHGEFAFLSACKTATGSIVLPDEVMTLASALHYTGFSHVVATLWSVWDGAAAQISEKVYGYLARNGGFDPDESAVALHRAVRSLRDRQDNWRHPSSWSPFVHTGP